MRLVIITKGRLQGACGVVKSVDAPSGHLMLELRDGPHCWIRPDWTREATDAEQAEIRGTAPRAARITAKALDKRKWALEMEKSNSKRTSAQRVLAAAKTSSKKTVPLARFSWDDKS